jgi:hypothetical protein
VDDPVRMVSDLAEMPEGAQIARSRPNLEDVFVIATHGQTPAKPEGVSA